MNPERPLLHSKPRKWSMKGFNLKFGHKHPAFKGAYLTVITIFGGLLIGLVIGDLVFHLLPGHNLEDPDPVHIAVAAIPVLVGGAAWGVSMGRLTCKTNIHRMALAGMLGFAPITITLVIGLSIVETISNSGFLSQISIHRLFTLLFVPAAFLISGISAWTMGFELQDRVLAKTLFWRVGLTAGGTFLLVNLGMESLGWVVGGPGAAQRLTMVTVLFLGNLSAALTAGGLMGIILSADRQMT
jgi:hypothetical protein